MPFSLARAFTATRAEHLWRASAIAFACIAPAMSFAHRSAPLFLILSAVIALLACIEEAGIPTLVAQAKASLRTPVGAAALVFLAFAMLSVAWSPAPTVSLYAFGEFFLSVVASLVLALMLPRRAPGWLWVLLGLWVIAAALIIVIDLWAGLPFRHTMGMRMNTFVYNRPTLTLLVLAPPLVAALWARGQRSLGAAVGFFVALAALRSDSGAASLGLIVGGAAWAVASWSRAAAVALALAAVVAAVALAPITGELLHRFLPPAAHARLEGSSPQARIDIWRSFGAAVRERPWIGTGFAPGPAFAQGKAAAAVDPGYRAFLPVGHPHNGALQIWAELGAVGAFLALVVLCLIIRVLAGLPSAVFAPSLALTAAAVAVSFVGHGLWQGWWAAVLGAAIVGMRTLAHEQARPGQEETAA